MVQDSFHQCGWWTLMDTSSSKLVEPVTTIWTTRFRWKWETLGNLFISTDFVHQESGGYDLRFCQHTMLEHTLLPTDYRRDVICNHHAFSTWSVLSRTTSCTHTHTHANISLKPDATGSYQFHFNFRAFFLKGLYFCFNNADCLFFSRENRFHSSAPTRISGRRISRLVRTCRFGQCNNHIGPKVSNG